MNRDTIEVSIDALVHINATIGLLLALHHTTTSHFRQAQKIFDNPQVSSFLPPFLQEALVDGDVVLHSASNESIGRRGHKPQKGPQSPYRRTRRARSRHASAQTRAQSCRRSGRRCVAREKGTKPAAVALSEAEEPTETPAPNKHPTKKVTPVH